MGMGETAENIAENYDLSREQQDGFAVESLRKAVEAQKSGRLKNEMIQIETKSGKIYKDGCIRTDTTKETLDDLKPAFSETRSVTAGTSSPLTDGASAVLVTTEEFAKKWFRATCSNQIFCCFRLQTRNHGHRSGKLFPKGDEAYRYHS